MAVLIRGMDMPKTCFKCKLSRITPSTYTFCHLNEKCYPADETPPSDCPLVEVPEHHGRLIDADALKESFYRAFDEIIETEFIKGLLLSTRILGDAPTVIPASEKEE